MTLKQRFKKQKGEFPKPGVVGVEGEWLSIGTIDVPKGSLLAVDVTLFNAEDGYVAKVPPGKYVVEGKAMDFKGHLRVSRVRAYLHGTEPALGKQLGETGTDSAMIAIADIKDVDARVPKGDLDAFGELLFEVEVDGGDIKTLDVNGTKVTFAACESGLGDGGYPVFALRQGKRSVGIEIEFIPPGFALDDDD